MSNNLWIHVGAGINLYPVVHEICKNTKHHNVLLIDKNPVKEYNQLDVSILKTSINDDKGIAKYVSHLHQNLKLIGCYPVSDNAIPAVCAIYEIFNFMPNVRRALRILRNKARTCQEFKYASISIPRTVNTYHEVEKLFNSGKPLIFKPINATDSFGIKYIESIHGLKNEIISEIENKNGLIQEFIDGELINLDFFIQDFEPILQSVNQRIQSHRAKYLTTLTIQGEDSSFPFIEEIKNSLKIFSKKIGYQKGALTIDIIKREDKYFALEASPFYHKPWLNILRTKMYNRLPFLFQDNNNINIRIYNEEQVLYAFELLLIDPSLINNPKFWEDLTQVCITFRSDHKRRLKDQSLKSSSSHFSIYASVKGTILKKNLLDLAQLHSLYNL